MNLSRLFLLSTLVLLFSACDLSLAADVTPPPDQIQEPVVQGGLDAPSELLYPLVPPDLSKGAAIYTDKCAPCHGAEGFGDGPRSVGLPNPVAAIGTTGVARESTPIQWYTVVSQGNIERFMPPFQSLTERQNQLLKGQIYSRLPATIVTVRAEKETDLMYTPSQFLLQISATRNTWQLNPALISIMP